MSYHANVTAALYLVEEIMPRVWAQRPEVKVWIVGKDPPREVQRLVTGHGSRITVTGTVPDIRPYLRQASVSVVPLVYGAGSQFKVLEAMACGTPVVATSQAVSALDVADGQHVLVADGPAPFAAAALRLLSDADLCRNLSEAGRRYVEQYHDWRSIVERLEETYAQIIAQ
jgi:glycosyltransferase involved in cell wall biosynthesis